MKKRSIALIIGLMVFALLGVMAMQFYFLRQSYHLQATLFDRSVREALNNVVSKAARYDAYNFLKERAGRSNDQDMRQSNYRLMIKSIHSSTLAQHNEVFTDSGSIKRKRSQRQKRLARLRDSMRHMIIRNRLDDDLFNMTQQGTLNFRVRLEVFTDEFGVVHQRMIPEYVNVPAKQSRHKIPLHKYDTLRYEYSDPQFGPQVISIPQINPMWAREQARKQKEKQIRQIKKMMVADSLENVKDSRQNVIQKLATEYQHVDMPLSKRVDSIWIDSLLRFELHNRGIYLPFSYAVTTASNDSLIFSKAMDVRGEEPKFEAENTYQTPIFEKEVINDPGNLKITFPQKNSLILSHMAFTMATSGGLMLVLILCFGYTIFSILRQKKISEMKTDFINNMTHEFKTPVSTIMIASEALRDDEIIQDKNRVAKLASIIYEENVRLGSHIERVLNIARIEKNDFKLDIKPVDVNELITAVLDSMSLKLQKYNATVTLQLDAEHAVINADELHFTNVLYNLIDNAIKYSRNAPEITVSTLNRNADLIIRVADKGIGMTRDQQSRIFEQFYRVPTGNLHDVKGFGLGLSYVNTIVKRLGGVISVRSEKDKGSEFELKFQHN
jgi:two-component system phosphate regulon sensor histidine kinase PhoR